MDLSGRLLTLALLLCIACIGGALATDGAQEVAGNIVVAERETLVFEDGTIEIAGTIFVEDNGTLIIRNARLDVSSEYDGHRGVFASGRATIQLENVEVDCPHLYKIELMDGATGSLTKVTGTHVTLWCSGESRITLSLCDIDTLDITDPATVILQSSTIRNFVRLNVAAPMALELNGLTGGTFDHLLLGSDVEDPSPRFSLSLADSTIGRWAMIVSGGADVKATDSEFDHLILSLKGVVGSIADLETGFISEWSVDTQDFFASPFRLSLQDCTVRLWGVITGGGTTLDFGNSTIDLTVGDTSYLTFTNCTIPWIGIHGGYVEINCTDCLTGTYIKMFDTRLVWTGSTDFRIASPHAWIDSSLLRTLELLVVQGDGTPVSGASVEVRDGTGRLYSTGTTDEAGTLQVTLWFDEQSWGFPYTASLPEYDQQVALGPFHDSPCVIRIPSD